MSSAPASRSSEIFAYPGCLPTISANGTSNAIVWIVDPAGVLRAYDASNLATELFNSTQNTQRDALGTAVKYSVPAVVNGKVYAGTQNSLAVYGLLSAGPVSIYGSNLATSTASASSFPIPTALGGAAVTANGISAPILYASPLQINAQIPFEVSDGAGTLSVTVNGQAARETSINIQASAPGLFVQQGTAAVVNQNGLVNSQSQPAAAGTVIAAYLTGLGAVTPFAVTGNAAPTSPLSTLAGVTATIGSFAASVQFAGLAPGFAGLYQVNILVPQMPAGQYLLQISVGGVVSNAAPVNIH